VARKPKICRLDLLAASFLSPEEDFKINALRLLEWRLALHVCLSLITKDIALKKTLFFAVIFASLPFVG
jgi:hypothetical protein